MTGMLQTKRNNSRRWTTVLWIGLGLSVSGCSFSLDWYRRYRVESAVARQDYETAVEILHKIMVDNPDSPRALQASRQGARLAHFEAKNYLRAVEFYKHVILRSPEVAERKSAQRYVAQIQFENIQDFNQSVVEYEKLLKLDNSPEEVFRYRLNLAKCQLKMNNIDQAVSEIDLLLAEKHAADELFEARVLKANTLVAAKRAPEAVSAWQQILREFPEKSKKENVALNLVVLYEDMKDFAKAIQVLEGMREGYPNPDFLDIRIQRLRERMGNQPGAQGWKR